MVKRDLKNNFLKRGDGGELRLPFLNNMNKKTLKLILMVLPFLLILSGCKSEPELTKEMIKKDVEKEILKEGDFDSISNFKYKESELSDSDVKLLKGKYTEKIPTKSFDLNFNKTSLELNQNAYYRAIFALQNKNKWTLAFLVPNNKSEWKTKPKGEVSTKHLLKDLKNIEFDGFKKGYIGDEQTTSIKIKGRDTDLKLLTDIITMEVEVKNEFAKYKINMSMNYNFKKNDWVLTEKNIAKQDTWKLEFINENKPAIPTPDKIKERLTTKEQIATYSVNPNFSKKLYVSNPKERIDSKRVIFSYVVIASYDVVGDIEYIVNVPFEYNAGNWSEKEIEIKYSKATLFAMGRIWKLSDGEYIKIDSVVKKDIGGKYTKDGKTVDIKGTLDIDRKDDLYNLNLVETNMQEGQKPTFEYKESKISIEKKALILDGKEFKAQAQTDEENRKIQSILQN